MSQSEIKKVPVVPYIIPNPKSMIAELIAPNSKYLIPASKPVFLNEKFKIRDNQILQNDE